LGPTGNSEELGQGQEQGRGQRREDIVAAGVGVRHVSLARWCYVVTKAAAAVATVTAGGGARTELTIHGDVQVGVGQQRVWVGVEESSLSWVRALVGELAGSTPAELGVHTGIVGTPRTAEWGPNGNVGSVEMRWRWEGGW